MQRQEEALNKHPYTTLEDKSGMNNTYLTDKDKGRIHKKRENKKIREFDS